MFRQLFVLVISLAAVVQSLKLESVQEGECLTVEPAKNVDQKWLANTVLPYISAGSRYHLYRFATQHPRYDSMRDFEFYYESCLQSHVNVTRGDAAVYGFGDGVIGNYLMKEQEPSVVDFIQLPVPGFADVSRHVITLTDNKNFILFANCWMGSNQRGWDLVTRTPSLDEKTQKLIEEHLMSLGFDRENFVFLRYDSCDGGPVPGSVAVDNQRGRVSAAELSGRRHRKGRY